MLAFIWNRRSDREGNQQSAINQATCLNASDAPPSWLLLGHIQEMANCFLVDSNIVPQNNAKRVCVRALTYIFFFHVLTVCNSSFMLPSGSESSAGHEFVHLVLLSSSLHAEQQSHPCAALRGSNPLQHLFLKPQKKVIRFILAWEYSQCPL